MAKINKRPLDDEQLEGGGTGAGMSASIRDTKWSNMPSLHGNASVLDDIKKLGKDTSHLKGGAKKSADMATDRAINRLAVRAGAGSAAGMGAKAMLGGKEATAKDSSDADNYEDMGGDVSADPSNPTGVAGKGMKKGGMTASERADGIASRGKTKGKIY